MYLLYFVLWVIFNANWTLEIALFGVVIAALIFAFTCKFMDYSIAKEKQLWIRCGRFLRYVLVLIKEIVTANFAVMHMILSEREELEPVLVTFSRDMKSTTGQALLANAITLTPGTITVTLEGSNYMVHALDAGLADGIDTSIFAEMIADLTRQGNAASGSAAQDAGITQSIDSAGMKPGADSAEDAAQDAETAAQGAEKEG